MLPGLVDAHTHPVFAAMREEEFALRCRGASYEEILAAAAGSSPRRRPTRAAGVDGLVEGLAERRERACSSTAPSPRRRSRATGSTDTELRSLRAIARAGGVPTFLGAHAVPPEFSAGDAYLEFLLAEVLPEASEVAEAADVFLERGAFDAAQARRYLTACREAGLALRLHADQFTEAGGVELAIELRARSVDHLEATGADGVRALAASDVAAVLLPVAALCLGRPLPPARALVDEGAIVALATDFNPGSAFCESLPIAMSFACTQMALSPAEALAACTVNAAHVLGRADRIGRIEVGCAADLVLLDVPDWRYLAYHLGGEHVATVVKEGEVVWER